MDARRRALGWSMAYLDDRAGGADGHFAKLLHADTPSGRTGTWAVLGLYAQALWPEGLAAVIVSPRCPVRRVRRVSNDNAPDQLELDLSVAGPHVTLRGWYRRRQPPRVYRRGGEREMVAA